MDNNSSADLINKYNDGLVAAPSSRTDIPPLHSPSYHPSPSQVAKARKDLPLAIVISLICTVALIAFMILLGWGILMLFEL